MANYNDYYDAGMRIFGLHGVTDGVCNCGNENCDALYKHPRVSSWQFTPAWTEEQLECMEMMGHFNTGFGVVCDGYLVIDVDPRNGGFESYSKLEKDLGINFKDESGFVVATGGGGWHIYFKNDTKLRLSKNVKDYPGIDFKSNGFVVGSGSLHKSGQTYESEKGYPSDIGNAPAKLTALLEKQQFTCTTNSTASSNDEIEAMLNSVNPDCDYEDWIHIGMAIHHATNGDGFLLWDNWSKNGAKYDASHMDFKWHSFGKSANPVTVATLRKLAEDNGYVEPVTFVTDLTEDTITEEDDDDYSEPVNVNNIDLSSAPGVLGDCINFINDNCRYPREHLAVGTAINTLGNIAGLRWRDSDFGVTSNTFVFCVAGSATGKEAVQDAQKQLQSAVGLAPATYGKIKSEQELTRNIVEHQLSSYIIDELGIFLQKLENATTRGSSSYLEGVIGDLMSIYSKADGYLLLSGDALKDTTKKLQEEINWSQTQIDENNGNDFVNAKLESAVRRLEQLRGGGLLNPFMSMNGFTTPVTFNGLVTYQSATNGFIGRALIFEEKDNNPKAKRGFKKSPISNTLKMKLATIFNDGNASLSPELRIEHTGEHSYIQTSKEAAILLDRIQTYLELYADHHCDTTGLEPIVRRAFEQVLKISMIVAIGDGRIRKPEHVQWAYAIVKKDIDNKMNLAGGNIAQESKRKADEIVSKVRHALDKKDGVTVGSISNKHRTLDKDQIEACLQWLERQGEAKGEEYKPKRGPVTTKWYLV